MKLKLKHIVCFYLIIASIAVKSMEKIRSTVTAETLKSSVDTLKVRLLINSIQRDGTWADIDYLDTTLTGFQHIEHLSNLNGMALAYMKSNSGFYSNPELFKAIQTSLNYWLNNDFIAENWWYNQIGTPSAMISLLYILNEKLTPAQRLKMLDIASRANLNAAGARPSGDRLKIAGLLARKELFVGNKSEFENALNVIEGELKIFDNQEGVTNSNYFSPGRKLESDMSFHHRPDKVNNTTSYGVSFLLPYVEWAVMLANTQYSFSQNSIQLAIDYFLDGICKQMLYGRSIDQGVLNRDIARQGVSKIQSPFLPESLIKLTDYRRDELIQIVKARKNESFKPASFAKFFWNTEHFVFQRPGFYTSVRMYSTRNMNMEQAYNGEGITNHFRADGANYISVSGKEYFDIAPVFDFRKIPGATILQTKEMPDENEIQKAGLTNFVGAVTNGYNGLVAFDFKSTHNSVKAKKTWFFFDNKYLCLGTSIQSEDSEPVVTALNQCFLNGKVLYSDGSSTKIKETGEAQSNKVKWVLHDGIAYYFPVKQQVSIFNGTVKGNWKRVNRQSNISNETIEKDVFSIWLNHGLKPENEKYEYIIIPNADEQKIRSYLKMTDIKVLKNDDKLQAARNDSLIYLAFYAPGNLQVENNFNISVNEPCLVMLQMNNSFVSKIVVSDPNRTKKSIEISINKKLKVNDGNVDCLWDKVKKQTVLTVNLPQGEFLGKSEIVSIEKQLSQSFN